MLTILEARTPEQFNSVRELCWDYRKFLLGLGQNNAEIVQAFYPEDKYADLMKSLECMHAPPTGSVKLVVQGNEPVGCGMSHTLMPGVAEIKRVYLRNSVRGMGAGRALMGALIDQCRRDGFERILMDTGKPMKAAQKLYLSMGFRLRGPYQEIHELTHRRLVFFELEL